MIEARFIIEAQGRPKSYVENALKELVEKMKMVKGAEIFDEHWEPTEEIEKNLFSGLVDVGVRVENIEVFFALILGFGPSAVVIQKPEKMEITMAQLQNVANDVINLLHAFAQANARLRGLK